MSSQGAAGAAHVPDVVAPPPRHPRFPLFDGLRAIAVTSVVVSHVALISGAFETPIVGQLLINLLIGVPIFFVISGFLLYRPFIAHRVGGPGAPRVPDYAKRRILRIVPAYWLALTVLTIYPGLEGVFGEDFWTVYGLVQVYPIYGGYNDCLDIFGISCGLSQAWSLAVEISFYALLPIFTVLAARLTARLSRDAWVLAQLGILLALSIGSMAVRVISSEDPGAAWLYSTITATFLWFAVGMGLAVLSVAYGHMRRPPEPIRFVADNPWLAWIAAFAVYAGSIALLPDLPGDRGAKIIIARYGSYGLVAGLLLLPAVFGDDRGGLPRRLLANPVVAWIGLVSYGIFLWHGQAVLELGTADFLGGTFFPLLVGTFAITIPCATISYYLLERPVLRFKYRSILGTLRRRMHRGGLEQAQGG